jgi:hypothetical protein
MKEPRGLMCDVIKDYKTIRSNTQEPTQFNTKEEMKMLCRNVDILLEDYMAHNPEDYNLNI